MQDRYAGDVGDFSKFALMRQLQTCSDRPLGLVWYRHPDEFRTNDGKHISYHHRSSWQQCDGELANLLKLASSQNPRTIEFLEGLPMFQLTPRFVGEYCHPMGRVGWNREQWFEDATHKVANCEIVFVDPDNGINLKPNKRCSPKHIDLSELKFLADRHKIVVAYHHFDRSESHRGQMNRLKDELFAELPNHKIEILRYRRISPRAYVCLVQPSACEDFTNCVDLLTNTPWDVHFER